MKHDKFGTIIKEWFNIDSGCQVSYPLHHIRFDEYLFAMRDHLVIATPGACLLHHFIANQCHCFWIIELNPSRSSPAGKFSKCENSQSILLFGCQFHGYPES